MPFYLQVLIEGNGLCTENLEVDDKIIDASDIFLLPGVVLK